MCIIGPREGDEQVRRLLEEFPDLDATNSLSMLNFCMLNTRVHSGQES